MTEPEKTSSRTNVNNMSFCMILPPFFRLFSQALLLVRKKEKKLRENSLCKKFTITLKYGLLQDFRIGL
jgi:hypothetical protein